MKRLLLLFGQVLLMVFAQANTYYFSSSLGNDKRTTLEAQIKATPWKTLDKLNAVFGNLVPGDSVLFLRGDTFTGAILISKSGMLHQPIVFSAYGSGANPVISGLVTLNQWTSSGGGIWETPCASCDADINLLLLNGQAQAVGRYPNSNDPSKGYLTFEKHSGTRSITDRELQPGTNWTGGEVVIRKKRWIIDKDAISAHNGNTIAYISNAKSYEPTDNFGYFIQRHPLTLDRRGEWYFDKDNKIMKIYLGDAGPQKVTVQASVCNTLILTEGQNHIVFDNLVFTGANKNAIAISDAKNITIQNCSFNFSGTNAITASGTDQLVIRHSVVSNTYNNAVVLGEHCNYAVVSGNKIINTGLFAGMGKSGDEAYQALIIKGSGNIVTSNQIENTGYIPIRFEGDNVAISNNYINNFDLVKDDGGGIYTYKNSNDKTVGFNRKIYGNIILNGKGTGDGTDDPLGMHAAGIYIDDLSDNIEVTANTVAFCLSGIYAHNAHDILVKENLLYNNATQLLIVQDEKVADSPVRNMTLKKNIFFNREASQLALDIRSTMDDIQQFGSFDSNYYCRPVSDVFDIHTSYQTSGGEIIKTHNLKSWQKRFGKDLNSLEPATPLTSYFINSLLSPAIIFGKQNLLLFITTVLKMIWRR